MWGADLPHSEGTSPYTLEALRVMLWDLPASSLDELLATRAAAVYDFDLVTLQGIADRIGPTVNEIKTPLPPEEYPRYPQDTRCTVFNQDLARLLEPSAG
jgi:hypothetical protein